MNMGNLLNRAANLIGYEGVNWHQSTGSTINNVLLNVPTYAAPVVIQAQVQPVPRSMFQTLGLDFAKSYIMLYTTTNLGDVERDATPDQIGWNGGLYNVLNNTEWFPVNGWNGTMCVYVVPGS